MRTLQQAAEFGQTAGLYARLRAQHPNMRALTIHRYMRNDSGLTPEQFECETELGHVWPRDIEERERCLCRRCGADGDA